MPDLPLAGDMLDSTRVQCVMLFHHDSAKFHGFLGTRVSRLIEEARTEGIDIPTPPEFSTDFMDVPSRDELVREAAKENARGADAGAVLMHLYEMAASNAPEPSTRKAIGTRVSFLERTDVLFRDGSEPNRSERIVRINLERHRCVAHLWAAVVHLHLKTHDLAKTAELIHKDLPFVLAVAEKYRRFGEEWTAERSKPKKPFLNAEKTWRVPEWYALPAVGWSPDDETDGQDDAESMGD